MNDYPIMTGAQSVLAWSKKTPQAVAVIWGTKEFTYVNLAFHIAKFVAALEKQSIKSGMIVCVESTNCYLTLVLILAMEVIQAVPAGVVKSDLDDSELIRHCDALITETPVPDGTKFPLTININQAWVDSTLNSELSGFDLNRLNHIVDDDDVVSLGSTSATTGKKKYFIRKRAAVHVRLKLLSGLFFSNGTADFISLYSVLINAGYLGSILALNRGGKIIISSLEDLPANVKKHPGSHASLLLNDLYHFSELYPEPHLTHKLSSVRVVGAFLPNDMRRWLETHLADRAVNSYSSNETSQISEVHTGGTGTIFPEVNVKIVDDCGNPVPSGAVGIIAVKSPMVVPGYLWNSELSKKHFADGWFISSDVGYMPEDNKLVVLGRADDMLIVGGCKVPPEPIETEIKLLDGVSDCVLLSDNILFGVGKVVACIEEKMTPDSKHLQESIVRILSSNFRTFALYYFEKFPRTETGKVRRKALRETIAEQNRSRRHTSWQREQDKREL